MASIFKKRILKERLERFSVPNVEGKLAIVQKWLQAYKNGYLQEKGEKEAEQEFIQQIFVEVLEHTRFPDNPYSIIPQSKTMTSGQKPDAILGYFENDKTPEKISAVCEIKDCNTPLDKSQKREGNLTPIQQAFKYRGQYKTCDFVIATNFFEIRLLKDNELNYEKWTLETLTDPSNDYFEFKRFYYLLCKDNFITNRGKSTTLQLLSDIQVEQESITKEFYKLYKELREKLIKNIWANNEEAKKRSRFYELAVEKAQKIIDRIVFVAFCEDLGLLPENILQKVIESDHQSYGSTWDTIKGFFKAVDIGSTKLGNADGYNGELFKPDEDLDKLVIDDKICNEFLKIGLYDFSEDLSVNILGHIFEQSISDLEELKNVGEDKCVLDITSKRKKDGIFYTPEQIVDYIVQNSVGAWLREQEKKILEKHGVKEDIKDKNYEKRYQTAYEEYQLVLQGIRVLDPACGSGAFLVKVFDFLLEENKRVVDVLADMQKGAITLFDTEKTFKDILQKNIYGVDLNQESVEITKLSLWLKTAQKGKKLATLKNNIKCGNSLIDDPDVAGAKAFMWEEEFKEIMESGGFDVIVGNPPYVSLKGKQRTSSIDDSNKTVDFLTKRFNKADTYRPNLFEYFIWQAMSLCRTNGYLSFLVPDRLAKNLQFKDVRKEFASEWRIATLVFDIQFPNVIADLMIFAVQNCRSVKNRINVFNGTNYFGKETLEQNSIKETEDFLFGLHEPSVKLKSLNLHKLSDTFTTSVGFIAKKDTLSAIQAPNQIVCLKGENVKRYAKMGQYFFEFTRENLAGGTQDLNKLSVQNKLLIRKTGKQLFATIDDTGAIPEQSLYMIYPRDNSEDSSSYLKALLAILNSRFFRYFYIKYLVTNLGSTPQLKKTDLDRMPIPSMKNNAKDLSRLSDEMLSLHKQVYEKASKLKDIISIEYAVNRIPNSLSSFWLLPLNDFIKKANLTKLSLAQKDDLYQLWSKYTPELLQLDLLIKRIDQEIDEVIFDLYGLTPEEKRIVLESTSSNA